MSQISVLLIHQYQILVDTLTESLGQCPDISLQEIAKDPTEAAAAIKQRTVDVILFDIRTCKTPVRSLRQLKEAGARCKILPFGLSMHEQIVELLEAGACGYVALEASFEELQQAIRQIHMNQAPSSPHVVAGVLERLRELSRGTPGYPEKAEVPALTLKEIQVLELVSQDYSNHEIARRLNISLSTVKMHVHHLLSKLNVEKRRDAVRVAAEIGLLKESIESIGMIGSGVIPK